MPTPPAPKWPSDRALRAQNKILLAERLRWPEGVLKACQDLERRYPGWNVSWLNENINKGFEHPAGFQATNESELRHPVEVFRTDAAELEAVLARGVPPHTEHPRLCLWCLHHTERPAKL